jgi:DNA-binding NtrC family response regulator
LIPLNDILLIDDEDDIVNALKIKLQTEGFGVHGFTDPRLALDCFMANPHKFSLIITDIKMHGMSGIDLLVKAKKICSDVKALVITAGDIDSIKHEIQRHALEVDDVFQKPFSLNKLASMIKNMPVVNNEGH